MGSKLEEVLLRRREKPGRALIGIRSHNPSLMKAMGKELPPPPDAPEAFKGTTFDELEKRFKARNK